MDGQLSFSNVVSVKVELDKPALKIFPNPTSNLINFHLSTRNGNMDIYIMDKSGRIVESTSKKQNSKGLVSLNLDHLISGIYCVKILSGNQVYNDKIAIVK